MFCPDKSSHVIAYLRSPHRSKQLFPVHDRKEVFIMAQSVNKKMLIGQLLSIDPNLAVILMRSGMHCIGCPSSQMESLEEAAMVHGIDADVLVEQINDYLAQ